MSTMWPFVVIGLFTGSIYALAAMGVVLTYKTTGIFNFAYGAVAMFCAFVYWQLHDAWHWSAWLAIPLLLLVVAPIVGAICEGLFRAFSGVSAEIPMVAALAMLLVLQVSAVLVWGGVDRQLQPIFPRSTFVLGKSLHVGWDQMGTLTVALALGAGLWWLLRRTRFGTATRAVVDNGELAEMAGVDTGTIRRGAWAISTMFAALVGILLSPTQGLDVNQLVLVVIDAFAPAVVGFIAGMPWAFSSAVFLGVLQSVLSRWSSSGTIADLESAIPYLALFVLLVVLGNRLKDAPGSIRKTDSGMNSSRILSASSRRRPLVIGSAILAGALALPSIVRGPKLGDVTIGAIFAIVALTLVVLTGWTGQISLAQFSFAGVGAFTVGHLSGAHGHGFLLATLAGMAMAIPLGVIVGLPSLRLGGLYLMLATFAFALVMDGLVFNRPDVSGGLTGMTVARPSILGVSFTGRVALYELAVSILGVLCLAAYAVSRGPVGRRLHIVRDSPLAAATLGVNLTVTKLVTFALCGAVAALGGALYAVQVQAIVPFDFQWSVSLELLLLVVLGGRSMIAGAVIAGAVVTVQHLQIPPSAVRYISLSVALGAIGLARSTEGALALAAGEARRVTEVLRPRPRRPADRGVIPANLPLRGTP